jgi:hypothetical protein
LDHTDIVSAVPDAADPLLGMFPYEAGYIGLLCRGTTAGNNCRKFGSDFNKLVLEQIQTQLRLW